MKLSSPRPVTRGESPPTGPVVSVSVDWLAFTFTPVGPYWKDDLCALLRDFFDVSGWDPRGGWQGYACSARVETVLVGWGGAAQRGSVHVEVPGSVCGSCRSWPAVVDWLHGVEARLTRVDIAGDDYAAAHISVDWAVAQFHDRGFVTSGRPPSPKLVDDLGTGAGKTFYVGSRANGKLARIYEKGRQLGDKLSAWCRFEVEWRAKDRVLPLDMLLFPVEFLAGAYPCAALFSALAQKVRTFKERATLTYTQAIFHARRQAGRAVNLMLQVLGGDTGAVVSLLRRSGLPSRINAADVRALVPI